MLLSSLRTMLRHIGRLPAKLRGRDDLVDDALCWVGLALMAAGLWQLHPIASLITIGAILFAQSGAVGTTRRRL